MDEAGKQGTDLSLETDRVRDHTSARVNAKIDLIAEARLARLEGKRPEDLGRRLDELDREWDIDRTLMLIFSIVGGATFSAGLRKAGPVRKGNGWLYLFSTQVAFLGIHAVFGWCPPAVLLRRMNVRTQKEIQSERRAVEALLNKAPQH